MLYLKSATQPGLISVLLPAAQPTILQVLTGRKDKKETPWRFWFLNPEWVYLSNERYLMRELVKKNKKPLVGSSTITSSEYTDDELLTSEIIRNYTYIIGSKLIYFNELSPVSKLRFIRRVKAFMATKVFHYIGLQQNPEIPVLISASAVQLTFGLRNFHLSHFKNIYVLGDAYKMEEDEEYFIGHVEPEGIYLSWKHFLYGYAVQDDNINVALHEMAHALLYNNFYAKMGMDAHFRLNYERFSSTTGPIIAEIITRRNSYLRGYAFTNIQEFWAVSIEAFFENPKKLKYYMPDLYKALCGVLNQDPMIRNKVIGNIWS